VWLQGYLADGEKHSTEVYKAAELAGISKTTVQRAKMSLRIHMRKDGKGGWYWKLLPDKNMAE
jgi:hypothetical protein